MPVSVQNEMHTQEAVLVAVIIMIFFLKLGKTVSNVAPYS